MTITARMFVTDPSAAVDVPRTIFDTSEHDAFAALRYSYDRAMAAGTVSIETQRPTRYGDRRTTVRDPFGNISQTATAAT